MANFEKNPKKPSQFSCLFCIKSDANVKKFKITEEYGGGNTIRNDLINFLGYQIESYLKDDDVLCSNCMNFFENMAYTKRRLIEFLKDRDKSADVKSKGFNDIWRGFTKFAVNLVKVNADDLQDSWETESYSRPQTPNPLMFKYSEVYDPEYERQLMERESIRSQSVARSLMSETDSEIRRLFRRKKRGHNWVRRKGEQKSRALSKSYDLERPLSMHRRSASVRSSTSSASKRRKRTVEGRPLKTRSVSRLETSDAERTAEIESQKFYCDDLSCPLFYDELDHLNMHKIHEHGVFPRYNCGFCQNVYTTRKDLDIHSRIHDEMMPCFQCGAELHGTKQFQEHVAEHQIYSVDCLYCFMSFLTREDLTRHVTNEHKGRNRNRVHEKMCRIFVSVQNEEKMRAEREANARRRRQYQAIVLINEGTPSPQNEDVALPPSSTPVQDERMDTPLSNVSPVNITMEEVDLSDLEIPDNEEDSMVIDDTFEETEEIQEDSNATESEHEITYEEVTENLDESVIEEPSAEMMESMDATVNSFDAQRINDVILGPPESLANTEENHEDNWQLTKMHPLVVLEPLDD